MPEIVIAEFMDEAAVADLASAFETLYDPGPGRSPGRARGRGAPGQGARRAQPDAGARRPPRRGAAPRGRGPARRRARQHRPRGPAASVGIAVRPAVGANELSVAEYVITAALVLLRGCWGGDRGGDRRRLAARAAERPRAFRQDHGPGRPGVRSAGRSPSGRRHSACTSPPSTLICRATIRPGAKSAVTRPWRRCWARPMSVSLHVPLSDGTRHLVSTAVLDGMKRGAVLINAARRRRRRRAGPGPSTA